jgi:hypothetical protein
MKKVIYSSLILATIMLTSCEKEEVTRNQSSSEENNIHSEEVVNKAAGSLRIYYDNGGDDFGCAGSGGNCYPTVTITPSVAVDLGDVIDGVNTGDEDVIRHSFLNNESLLIKLLGSNTFENVIEGTYFPSTRGDLTEANSIYFVFEVDNKVVEVKPIQKK